MRLPLEPHPTPFNPSHIFSKRVSLPSMDQTLRQYREVIDRCKNLFLKKTADYGTSWRILRPSSLTDQIFIKGRRIRSIEEKGLQQIADSIESEYVGIVNYAVLALIQQSLPEDAPLQLPAHTVEALYDAQVEETIDLLLRKNHDYDEVWREMRVSSMTDLILQKILRIKQIEDNKGETFVSEGLEANYRDILNYAVFALIRLQEDNPSA